MRSPWLVSFSCLAMAVAGMVTLSSEAQAQPTWLRNYPVPPHSMTTVYCAGTVTVAQKGHRQATVITWTPEASSYFEDPYTPEVRCHMVSDKLHSAVAANGGTFSGLRFKNGPLNGEMVVCILGTGQDKCNYGNMLFTLKPENRRNVHHILRVLTKFGVYGSSDIVEASGEEVQVDLSDLDKQLETSEPADTPQPESQPTPNNTGF